MSDQPFLSRVYDCKYRFEKESGFVALQLFMGPKECQELAELLVSDPATREELRPEAEASNSIAGMTIIGLAYDGMRVGISSP